MATLASDIINNALIEIGALAAGEVAAPEDQAFGLVKLNRLLDLWNSKRAFVYNLGFVSYVLTPNHQPHLIGPGLNSPDFAVAVRPVEIINANIVLTGVNPNVRVPLNIRDDAWWANQRVQGIPTSLPTDLYYSPDWPSGSLFLWPIPTVANKLELETRGILSGLTINQAFSLPPGYEEAITLTLAEGLCRPFGTQVGEDLANSARKARASIQSLNTSSPRTSTLDSGMPGSGGGGFNYYSGQ